MFRQKLKISSLFTDELCYKNKLPQFQGSFEQKIPFKTLKLGEGGLLEGNFMKTCQVPNIMSEIVGTFNEIS